MKRLFVILVIANVCFSCSLIPPKKIWLHELDISKMETGYGIVRANMSCDSNKLSVGGKVYERGVGTHAVSKMMVDLHGRGAKFCSSAAFSSITV